MPNTVVLLLSVVPLAMVLMMIVSQRAGEVSDAYTGEITGRGCAVRPAPTAPRAVT